jgi:hypothetical protein
VKPSENVPDQVLAKDRDLPEVSRLRTCQEKQWIPKNERELITLLFFLST